MLTHVGRGMFPNGQPRPLPEARGHSASKSFGRSRLFMPAYFDAERPVRLGNTYGEAACLGVSHALHPKGS